MLTIVVLFAAGLAIGFVLLTYWRQLLVILAACCFAIIFAGVLRIVAVINTLHGQGG